VFALVKEYVVHTSAMDESSGIAQGSKISVKSASSSSGDNAIAIDSSNGDRLLEEEVVKLNEVDARAAKHESVIILVAAPPDLASSGLSDGEHFIVTSRVSEPRMLVQLESGSQGERMVKTYGLAALSYHQALDIICEANGLRPVIRLSNGEYDLELEEAVRKSELDQTMEITEHVAFPSSRPSWLVNAVSSVWKTIMSAFLPTGYPDSVSPDYASYYRYLFFHNVAGSFSYVMSMTALLQAVGISTGALGAAAAVSWVMKDGLGAVGMIFAAKVLGDANTFDANTIRSKFRADVVHNLGVALELMTMLFPASFLLLASGANTLKGVAGLVSGACKASINQRMAIANNLGDLTAKGHVQGLAAYLTGLSLGVCYDRISHHLVTWVDPSVDRFLSDVLSIFGITSSSQSSLSVSSTSDAANAIVEVASDIVSSSTAIASSSSSSLAIVWCLFLSSAAIHLFCSYRALRALALPSLNQSRTHLLIEKYLQANPVLKSSDRFHVSDRDDLVPTTLNPFALPETHIRPRLPTPYELAKEAAESIILPSILDSAPRIILGASVSRAFKDAPQHLQPIVRKSIHSPYIIHGDHAGTKIYIVLSSEANSKTMLKSFFHACTARAIVLSEEVTSSIWTDNAKYDMLKAYVDREYPYFETQLEEAGWRLDQILLTPKPFRADWTLSGPSKSL